MTRKPNHDVSRASEEALFVAEGVLRVRPVVHGVVRRVLGANDPEYEDVLQSSLERVIETFHEAMLQNCSMPKWAAVVARNVAVDALRSRLRERKFVVREDDGEAIGRFAGVDPERLLCARDRLAQFERALARLRAGNARVVYMHDVLGFQLSEIAGAIGVSVAACQSRLVRGRRQIAARDETEARSARRRSPCAAGQGSHGSRGVPNGVRRATSVVPARPPSH